MASKIIEVSGKAGIIAVREKDLAQYLSKGYVVVSGYGDNEKPKKKKKAKTEKSEE